MDKFKNLASAFSDQNLPKRLLKGNYSIPIAILILFVYKKVRKQHLQYNSSFIIYGLVASLLAKHSTSFKVIINKLSGDFYATF